MVNGRHVTLRVLEIRQIYHKINPNLLSGRLAARYETIGLIVLSLSKLAFAATFNASNSGTKISCEYQSACSANNNLRTKPIDDNRCFILNVLYLLVWRRVVKCSRCVHWISLRALDQRLKSSAIARYATTLTIVDCLCIYDIIRYRIKVKTWVRTLEWQSSTLKTQIVFRMLLD